jgi:alanyl-tRNA synthetase
MNAKELRTAYHTFFEERGHRRIPSAPLLPENDASVLFTTAGMQPLVPYLLGEPHPLGRRLVNVQKCIRTNDIEEVGDASHLTFFEMLGNWSLGDYFKSESLAWSMEFLTEVLKIERVRLAVTVFAGDEDAPRDEQSFQIWRKLGMPEDRIFYLPREENWWGPVGQTGPCGPDSEIFYDTGRPDHPGCRPGCPCGKWFEIWNNVFMEYNRTLDGRFERLPRPNVDTGMGVDRTVAALNGYDDTFRIETIWPIVRRLEELSGRSYTDDPRPFRVIADHVRAAVMAIVDGARPSNVEAGYIVRRLIRRSMVYARQLGVTEPVCGALSEVALEVFSGIYPSLEQTREETRREIEQEESRFLNTLERGLKHYHRTAERALEEGRKAISGQEAFDLFQTYGFPCPLRSNWPDSRASRWTRPGLESRPALTGRSRGVGWHRSFAEGWQTSQRKRPTCTPPPTCCTRPYGRCLGRKFGRWGQT